MLFVSVVGRYSKDMSNTSPPGYGFLQKTIRDLPGAEQVALLTPVADGGHLRRPQRIETQMKRATPSYWQILDFHFIEGAPFTAADDAADRRVAVITDALARQGPRPAARRSDGRSTSAARRIASSASSSRVPITRLVRICRDLGADRRGQRRS